MKGLRLLSMVVAVVALALGGLVHEADGATVTITHAGGTLTGTLSSISVDSVGNTDVHVVENLTGGGSCSNTAPTLDVTGKPTTATVGVQVSATVTVGDADGDPVTLTTANQIGGFTGSGSTWTWSWTPGSAGTYTIKLTADDGQTCNNTTVSQWQIVVTDPSGGGSEPKHVVLQQGVWTRGFTIGAKSELFFEVPLAVSCKAQGKTELRISFSGYAAGSNVDLLVKKSSGQTVPWPTYADYTQKFAKTGYTARTQTNDGTFFWYFKPNYEGEMVSVANGPADTYYVYAYNNSSVGTSMDMYFFCY